MELFLRCFLSNPQFCPVGLPPGGWEVVLHHMTCEHCAFKCILTKQNLFPLSVKYVL